MILPAACPSPEQFQRALACSSRALARDPGLRLNFSAQQDSGGSIPIQWPAEAENMAAEQLATVRGRCDAVAMKVRFHDAGLHRAMAPAGPVSHALYDALEDLRVEACAARSMLGVAGNLLAVFAYKFQLCGTNVLEMDAATSLANAVVLAVRARLLGKPLPAPAKRLVSRWQDEIIRLSGNGIDLLGAVAGNQAAYARQSRRLIEDLELVDDPQQGPQAKPVEVAAEHAEEAPALDHSGGEGSGDDGPESLDAGPATSDHGEGDDQQAAGHGDHDPEAGASGQVIPFPPMRDSEPPASPPDFMADPTEGSPEPPEDAEYSPAHVSAYHVYTKRFDEVVHARDMIGKGQLVHLRRQLDQEISEHRRVAMKLANRLQNSLRVLQKRAWTFDLDDGLLNTTRLSRLVIDPTSPLVYKQERDSQTRDTVVSFLVDNSGSMRGRPITLAAMFTSILAQALERCQVSTEILGFTTRQWRGGQSGKRWRSSGRPDSPGRLSDLRHVIYKTADEPWRRARQSLATMLWPDLLKENVDGEALLWAHSRLAGRVEQRRILLVISDGVPADDATLTANTRDYLEKHLHLVVDWIEARSSVELLAIGIGHDVGAIYARSVTIADSEQLGEAMAHELIELLATRQVNRPPATTGQQRLNINY